MAGKRIGVLTGGGDVPGLNSAIKGIVEAGLIEGYEILGICRGWEGLTHINFDDPESVARYTMPLAIRLVGNLFPLTYFIQIARGIITKGVGFAFVWEQVAALLVYIVVIMIVATRAFRQGLD